MPGVEGIKKVWKVRSIIKYIYTFIHIYEELEG